jgi:SAM-dependent methyltransferase
LERTVITPPPEYMPIASVFSNEADQRTRELRARLDAFYESATDYESFEAPSDKPEFWGPIRDEIIRIRQRQGACEVLEFGAGRTSFRRFLGDEAARVTFHVQDVTGRHREYLTNEADQVHIGDVRSIGHRYDVIFSTFVWEHVTDPRAVLDHLLGLLNPGGSLFLVSPRYDFPLYVGPSARHYSRLRQLGLSAWLLWRRALVRVGGRPDFLIHLDPAVLHHAWYRDADAIHWASLHDLSAYTRGRYRLQRHRIRAEGLLRRVWEKYMLLFVQLSVATPPTADGNGSTR